RVSTQLPEVSIPSVSSVPTSSAAPRRVRASSCPPNRRPPCVPSSPIAPIPLIPPIPPVPPVPTKDDRCHLRSTPPESLNRMLPPSHPAVQQSTRTENHVQSYSPTRAATRPARSSFLATGILVALASVLITAPAAAQHPLSPSQQQHDESIPKPGDVLGYELGEQFTPHHMVSAYFQEVARRSPLVRLDTLGRTVEGREVILAVVTSEANHARMDAIQADLQLLADPREAGPNADAAVARTPAVAWMGYTVHGNEASGT